MTLIEILAVIAGAYLVGAIPFGYLCARFIYGIDIRKHGSGNIGATNVARVLGWKPGIVTLALDFLKGYVPVAAGLMLFDFDAVTAVAAGGSAIAGHNWPVYLKFHGGKGVITSAGVLFAIMPWPMMISLAVFGIVAGTSRIISLGSIVAACVMPVVCWFMNYSPVLKIFSFVCAGAVIFRHRSNIKRLLSGKEPRFCFRA